MNVRYLCAMQENASDTIQLMITDSVTSLVSDSIPARAETPVVSIFAEHQLKDSDHYTYLERKDFSNGFGFAVLFICAAIIVYLQRSSDGIFSSVFRSSFDNNIAQQEARTENSQRTRNLVILQVSAFISISLFISAAIVRWLELDISLSTVFFGVLAVSVGFMILKRSILQLLAFIFDLKGELKIHNYNLNIFISAVGVSLLPLSLLLFYSPSLPTGLIVYTGMGIGLLFHLKGLLRGLLVAFRSKRISPLHLFYYFCALEILPVFVLVRIAQSM